MAGGKELRADIVIGGKADASFYALGGALQTLGGQLSVISDKLIDFGTESTKVYTGYEDNLLDTQVALRTQYESASELQKVMKQLDSQAMQWANNTRFTTTDVTEAISEASHAGWDLDKILEGIPAAMNISMAGSMSLSEGLEYLVDITNAAGLSFEDLGSLTDYWAYAANKSSTTIPEMGAAMQKMGATMSFVKGDMAGLTTMLAVLANNGTKGTEAGTLLRNSMIRLLAPTQTAAEAMDALNLSSDELEEIYSNTANLEKANAALEEAGFSAYDANGNLKSFLTTFEDLNRATKGMTEQERNEVLSAIFPSRTITGALALLDAAGKGWDGMYDNIRSNGSGYAEYAAETMESGLGGALRHLESVYNVTQTRTGKALSGLVETGAEGISGLLDRVNGMDDSSFRGLVGGLTGIAAVGPGLTIAGGAVRLISMILGTGTIGKLALAGTALAGIVGAMAAYNEAQGEAKFGDLSLDTEAIGENIRDLNKAFRDGKKDIETYGQAAEDALSSYETASGSLKEGLLNGLFSGGSITEDDKRNFLELGDQAAQAVLEGIQAGYREAKAGAEFFSGGETDGVWAGVLDTLEYGYSDAIQTAQSLSNQLREAMTSAFADGNLTSEEIDNIQSILQQQNELIAMAADAKNATEREKILRQAQTLGMDGLEEVSTLAENQRDAELQSLEDNYWDTYYQTKLSGELKIKNGAKKADGTLYSQADLDRELNALWDGDPDNPFDGYVGKRKEAEASYASFLLDLYSSTIAGSEYGNAWDAMNTLVDDYLASGTTTATAMENYRSGVAGGDRAGIQTFLRKTLEALGGESTAEELAGYFAGKGDYTSANALQRVLTAYGLANLDAGQVDTQAQGLQYGQAYRAGYTAADARAQEAALEAQDGMAKAAWEGMKSAMETGIASQFSSYMSGDYVDTGFQTGIRQIVENLKGSYDLSAIPVAQGLEGVQDYAAAYRILFEEGFNAEAYKIDVDMQPNAEPLQQAIAAADGQSITVTVNGDTTPLQQAVASAGAGGSRTGTHGGRVGKFAGGGRATEASIFGEAGAEWAIPESHSQRTAELLNAARAASGFTWGDLISRNGGLNAGNNAKIGEIIYSPTIYAQDSRGVDAALREDKERFARYWRERELREAVESV